MLIIESTGLDMMDSGNENCTPIDTDRDLHEWVELWGDRYEISIPTMITVEWFMNTIIPSIAVYNDMNDNVSVIIDGYDNTIENGLEIALGKVLATKEQTLVSMKYPYPLAIKAVKIIKKLARKELNEDNKNIYQVYQSILDRLCEATLYMKAGVLRSEWQWHRYPKKSLHSVISDWFEEMDNVTVDPDEKVIVPELINFVKDYGGVIDNDYCRYMCCVEVDNQQYSISIPHLEIFGFGLFNEAKKQVKQQLEETLDNLPDLPIPNYRDTLNIMDKDDNIIYVSYTRNR